ncbi:DUF6680 family protein [Sphingomonas sanguinis]|nr:DUF6680 family protein [Sphingomonas sanguinis]MBZ6380178.1 hypothetical protein [Sphingomonas sanguinis]NNG48809.1 hypothetical protein [Sphingomonas sanguinis]NVP29481.1 hypothetical protein [Sphingomonas sanguinis]
MKIYEFINLIGLFVGPISAVIITLWYQQRSGMKDRQTQTLRMLINTRHMAADPAYSVAINMVPIEFNNVPSIMTAWEKYIEVVRYRASEDNVDSHHKDMTAKQTQLIFSISRHLGYKISETDIQSSAYVSQGYIDRDQLAVQSQVAWIRIANALEGQNAAAGLPDPPSPEQLIPEQKPVSSES